MGNKSVFGYGIWVGLPDPVGHTLKSCCCLHRNGSESEFGRTWVRAWSALRSTAISCWYMSVNFILRVSDAQLSLSHLSHHPETHSRLRVYRSQHAQCCEWKLFPAYHCFLQEEFKADSQWQNWYAYAAFLLYILIYMTHFIRASTYHM